MDPLEMGRIEDKSSSRRAIDNDAPGNAIVAPNISFVTRKIRKTRQKIIHETHQYRTIQ